MADLRNERNSIKSEGEHSLVLASRRRAKLTGVIDVKAFDENEIVIDTNKGMLVLQGSNLHVKSLTLESGETEVEGDIDRLLYQDKTAGDVKSLMARIFR